jgi:light-regulated signal transduction histidine kinase (bacteriophytochrome)
LNQIKNETLPFIETLIDSVGLAVVVVEPTGQITYANDSAHRLLAIDINQTIEPEQWSQHYGLFLADGTSFIPDEQAPIICALKGQKLDNQEIRIAPVKGRHKGIWASINLRPIYGERGNITGAVLLLQDITERKHVAAEAKRAYDDLQQFASVAAHDLQEPLRSISGFSDILANSLGDDISDQSERALDKIKTGVTRMRTLILDLLTYSRIPSNPQAAKLIDTNDLVKQCLQNLEGSILASQANITIQDLPDMVGNYSQISQVFQNLLGNALKFKDANRPLEVSVTAEPSGLDWKFAVSDNGIGIAQEFSQRIFLVFQRLHTRDVYSGNGIGLSVCQRIIERHGGKIWVESTPGQGSTFLFTIPRPAEEQQ